MTGDKQILLLAQKTPRTMIRAKMACTAWVRSLPCCSCSSCRMAPSRCWSKASSAARSSASSRRKGTFVPRSRPSMTPMSASARPRVFTRSLLSQFEQYVQLGKKVPAEVLSSLNSIDEPSRLVDTMAAHMALKIEQKQDILEITDLSSRVEHVLALLDAEIDLLQVEKRIRGRVKKQMEAASASTT